MLILDKSKITKAAAPLLLNFVKWSEEDARTPAILIPGEIHTYTVGECVLVKAQYDRSDAFSLSLPEASLKALKDDRWVHCDGAELSRKVYADLFGAIGCTYGKGDRKTTYNLPDFRNRVRKSPIGQCFDTVQELRGQLGIYLVYVRC